MLRSSTPSTIALTLAAGIALSAAPVCAEDPDAGQDAGVGEPDAARLSTAWEAPEDTTGRERSDGAWRRRRGTVEALFARAAVPFPPARLLLRVYKQDRALEVWAAGGGARPLRLVATYEICAQGDELGPKRRQGDSQTPEGFYTLDFYNWRSTYHLAMRVSYPNRLDRQLRRTGGAIMIHGDCASIGCVAVTDERIEELWVMADAARKRAPVAVHIFPARDLAALIAGTDDAGLRRFWRDLKAGHDAFEAGHRLPRIGVRKRRYVVLSR